MFPKGPFWDVRFVPPLVAVRCFAPEIPSQIRGTLVNVASAIQWKIERSSELQTLLSAVGSTGLRIVLAPSAGQEAIPFRFLEADGREVAIGFPKEIDRLVAQDDVAAEAAVGAALAEGVHAIARAAQRDFDPAAFVVAWSMAPRGLRSQAIEVPVAGGELPAPTPLNRALLSRAERELARRLRDAGVQPGRYEGAAATSLESDRIAPILRAMLSESIAAFERESLLATALSELEQSLCAKWFQEQMRRQKEQFPELAYDPVELELQEGHDSHKLTRVVTLLAEEILTRSGETNQAHVNRVAWMALLAVADLLMESYIRSESNHYGLVPAVTVIDEMFAIKEPRPTDPPIFDQKGFAEARARSKIASAKLPQAFVAEVADQQRVLVARVSTELFNALGFTLETVATVLDIGRTWPRSPGTEVFQIAQQRFFDRCAEIAPDQDVDEAEKALEYLTLRPAQLAGDIEHWEQERRSVRLMTRPFVEASTGSIWVLPWQCEGSKRVLFGYLTQGRLTWLATEPSPKLKSALDDLREFRNKRLELEVDEVARRVTPYVRRNVGKAKALGLLEAVWAGEIDCIAIDENRNVIVVADAKDVFSTFSPTTIARTIQRFNGPDQYVDRLLKKVNAVSSDPNAVAATLGVPSLPREWNVKPLMVTRSVEPAAFATNQRVPFCTISELEELLRAGV